MSMQPRRAAHKIGGRSHRLGLDITRVTVQALAVVSPRLLEAQELLFGLPLGQESLRLRDIALRAISLPNWNIEGGGAGIRRPDGLGKKTDHRESLTKGVHIASSCHASCKTIVLLKASRRSEQYQVTNSSIAC